MCQSSIQSTWQYSLAGSYISEYGRVIGEEKMKMEINLHQNWGITLFRQINGNGTKFHQNHDQEVFGGSLSPTTTRIQHI